jgi:hypothetical protein
VAFRGLTLPSAAGIVLTLAIATLVFLRLPTAFRNLDGQAAAEVGRNQEGGALAAADMVGLNDDFVRTAIHLLPRNAQFAAVVPDPNQAATTYGIATTTILAVPDLMQEVLLPRREITAPQKGAYILCYLCDTSPWDNRTHWLWKGTSGGLIGLVYR